MKVAVIGGGAWGTALACAARSAGHEVMLWARNEDVVRALCRGEGNPLYLPDVPVSPEIVASGSMEEVLQDASCAILAVPAQAVRTIAGVMSPRIVNGFPVAVAAKGIERTTLKRMTTVVGDAVPTVSPVVVSGPTFADEVAKGLPAAVTVAARDRGAAELIRDAIGTNRFRPYLSDDPVGVEIGGAVKNVIAIAAGIATGRGLGENARAALITRGLAEMTRLAVALGGRADTMAGLAGLGDLTLTATSVRSRNMSFGVELGKGRSESEILAGRRAVTEGFFTAQAVTDLAAKENIEMPISAAVAGVLSGVRSIDVAMGDLLSRPYKAES